MHQSMRKTRPRPFWTGYTTEIAPAPTIGPRHCRLCQGHGLRNYRLQLLLRTSPRLLRRTSPKPSRRTSPRLLRRTSPKPLRRTSPKPLLRISPKLLRRISPKLLRRISLHLLCLIKRQRIFRTECPVYYRTNARRIDGELRGRLDCVNQS
jgi:hypothetical protein